ncbi:MULTISPECIES: M20/M25/M40 family metallo-hydrolase [Paenibacillus]|jgi:metal-dependent amidase/aminoacylase/carboxypeptidase family protein|uniref:Metal-dependent amidase/aminoacylase/carboxypeptidase family protein n=2 Tax=Paenibacillus TaxID=44249 RepID=A0ABS4FIV5_9BACL|nr:M20/M25/M40 family metallo-hydrolase [Paenibacillus lactis]MBP1895967.1 metal-dependent amidase/aminoacylase/carboxypeptidase family protein [Paenibacillus lactis]
MKAAVEHEEMMVFAGELREELSRIRRDLHQYPELVYDVFRTSKLVADLLECGGAGGSYKLELREGMAVLNDGAALRRMTQAAGKVLGEEQVQGLHPPSSAGEDFDWYQDQVPGAFGFIGCGNPDRGIVHAIHQPRFDPDEDVLVHGTRIWVRLAVHDVYE